MRMATSTTTSTTTTTAKKIASATSLLLVATSSSLYLSSSRCCVSSPRSSLTRRAKTLTNTASAWALATATAVPPLPFVPIRLALVLIVAIFIFLLDLPPVHSNPHLLPLSRLAHTAPTFLLSSSTSLLITRRRELAGSTISAHRRFRSFVRSDRGDNSYDDYDDHQRGIPMAIDDSLSHAHDASDDHDANAISNAKDNSNESTFTTWTDLEVVYDRIAHDKKVPSSASVWTFAATIAIGIPLWLVVLVPLSASYQLASALGLIPAKTDNAKTTKMIETETSAKATTNTTTNTTTTTENAKESTNETSMEAKKKTKRDSLTTLPSPSSSCSSSSSSSSLSYLPSLPPSDYKPRKDRTYDVVLLGATGYTGRLAAEYLASTYGPRHTTTETNTPNEDTKIRWAVAGRSESKLRQLLSDLSIHLKSNNNDKDNQKNNHDPALSVDLIVADASDPSTLSQLVSNTRVVITTAGPFSAYGSNVVKYCAWYGTHYADITGEIDWYRQMMRRYGHVAKKTGAKLVSLCGHDSVPWDLTVYKLAQALKEHDKKKEEDCEKKEEEDHENEEEDLKDDEKNKNDEEELAEVECVNELYSAGPSGGTIATIFLGLDGKKEKGQQGEAHNDNTDKLDQDEAFGEGKNKRTAPPFSLLDIDPLMIKPDGSASSCLTRPKLPLFISRTLSLGGRKQMNGENETRRRPTWTWTTPFVMANINAETVRRSNAILQLGSNLTYKESQACPNFVTAFVSWTTLVVFLTACLNPMTAWLVRTYVLPSPGDGPDRSVMEQDGYLCVSGYGVGTNGTRVESAMYFPVDAGYLDTARMLVESGLCLALEARDENDNDNDNDNDNVERKKGVSINESSKNSGSSDDDTKERKLMTPSKATRMKLPSNGGGFYTPASGLGDALLDRLCRTGTVFACRVVPKNQ